MGLVVTLGVLGLALFGLWRWATAVGSAETLDWIDARFPRSVPAELEASGSYGSHAAQHGELWVPGRAAPAGGWPLVVFVHGGGWHSGAPREYRFVARTLAEHGYATALIGYRLVPDGRFPAMLQDTAAGVHWAREVAAQHHVSPDRVGLVGHSAGAYNVLMLALDPQWLAAAGVPRAAIASVTSMAGPADFYPFTADSSRAALGNAPDPQLTQPIHFAATSAAPGTPPILLLHGTSDDVVKLRNARNLAAAIQQAGGRVREIEFAGMGHAGIVMGLSKPFAQGGKVLDPLLAFLAHPEAVQAPPSVPVQRKTG